MGRPKGSKNRATAFDETLAQAAAMPGTQVAAAAAEIQPSHVTIRLTDEDLAPIRQRRAAHERAAAEFRAKEIAAEQQQLRAGEIEELSVPQVVEFDMSGAFNKLAQQKCREAGYRFMSNLRKTPEGWVFDASNEEPKRTPPGIFGDYGGSPP